LEMFAFTKFVKLLLAGLLAAHDFET